jgi:HSP20 family molecular chaperone IbpA
MTGELQLRKEQSVSVVEADILDRMNETDGLIAEGAYEIYQSRSSEHRSDQPDWFGAEQGILYPLAIHRDVSDGILRLTAQLPGFDAKDLEVVIGHGWLAICGVHPDSDRREDTYRKTGRVIRILDLPFDIDPLTTRATLRSGRLQVALPRRRHGRQNS